MDLFVVRVGYRSRRVEYSIVLPLNLNYNRLKGVSNV
jgi:hypothetical protein